MNAKLHNFISEQPRENIIAIFMIVSLAAIAPFFGGWDYLFAFRAETLSGNYFYTYNPLPAYWFFYPFAVLPPLIGYILWNLVNAFGFIYALYKWKANMLAFALTIVCFWNFFGGQFEGFLAAAMVFALIANPWLAGFGIFVLTFKPQVGFIIILFALIQRREWRMLMIPGIIYLLSFLIYGWWVPAWLNHIRVGYEITKFGNTNISMYPIGILFLLLILRYRKSIKIWILSISLAMPYYPIYSLAGLFTMESPPWWFSLVIWVFYIIPDIFPQFAAITLYAYFIPISLLVAQVWKEENLNRKFAQIQGILRS